MTELLPLVPLAVLLLLHAVGSVRLDRRASRRTRRRRALRATAFLTGVLVLAVALSPPVDGVADRSVAAHMGQHLALLVAAPPLLVWSEPLPALLTALPPWLRRGLGKGAGLLTARGIGIATVVAATEVHVGLMFLWHAPPLYDAAQADELTHAFEHVTFLASGLLFWSCLARVARRGPGGCALGLAAVVAASVQSAVLGVLLTLSSTSWYDVPGPPPFGLTRLADQQAAGAEMWVVAGGVYVIAAAVLTAGIVRTPAGPAVFARAYGGREADTGAREPAGDWGSG
jgi:cytochrome c oxidase assembly factor CtaG